MSSRTYKHIGQPLRRKEDDRLLTGKGRFTDDFSLPDQLHAVMVRSPFPHARIRAIDKTAALAAPGVAGVFTAADLKADGLRPIPHDPLPSTKHDMQLTAPDGTRDVFIGPHDLLPTERARHVGVRPLLPDYPRCVAVVAPRDAHKIGPSRHLRDAVRLSWRRARRRARDRGGHCRRGQRQHHWRNA